MFLSELRKLLIKQKGIWIIIIMLALKATMMITKTYDIHHLIERNPQGYTNYINKYKGKLTDEKEKNLKAEYNFGVQSRNDLEDLLRKRKAGVITEELFQSSIVKVYESKLNQGVFSVIYNQYFYVKEDPERRYFINEAGWNNLLTHSEPDIFLIITLVAYLSLIFCREYELSMDQIILSSIKGKYHAAFYKLISGGLLSAGITILFSFVEYVCIGIKTGLPDGSFPLQSLQFFQNSPYLISLEQTFIYMTLCRVLGSLMLLGVISTLGVIIKKTIPTLIFGTILLLLPYIVFNNNSALLLFPLPSGLLSGAGYFWGTSNEIIIRNLNFQAIEPAVFSMMMIVFGVETILLCLFAYIVFSNRGFKFKISALKFRSLIIGLLTCLIFYCFSGCEKVYLSDENITVNGLASLNYGETSEYSINFDVVKGTITAKNKKTDDKEELLRDPFGKDAKINGIYVTDEMCFYLSKKEDSKGIRVYCINMSNFSKSLIYNSVDDNNEDFFGLKSKYDLVSDFNKMGDIMANVSAFFLNDSYIYYVQNSQLIRINRATGLEKILSIDVSEYKSIFYHHGNIYYIDTLQRINIYNSKSDSTQIIEGICTDHFEIQENTITYNSIYDAGKKLHYEIFDQQ